MPVSATIRRRDNRMVGWPHANFEREIMKPPETRYARSGDVRIAYQVIGNGPIDLVFVPGFLSNLEVHWEDPGYSHLLQRLGAFTRLIPFPQPGTRLRHPVAHP